MPDQNNSLFAKENLQREVSEIISGEVKGRLSIAYVGTALEDGRMDAVVLADGLKGMARFVNRVAQMHLGPTTDFYLEVEGEPRSGSLEVFVRFSHALIESVDWVGGSRFFTGLAIIASLTGFSAKDVGKSLLTTFKKLRGISISDHTDLNAALPVDLPIDKAEFIKIYNDPRFARPFTPL